MVKIILPLNERITNARTMDVEAEIAPDIAPHAAHIATWAVHKKPWASSLRWRVSNVETGYALGFADAESKREAIQRATSFLGARSEYEIESRMLNAAREMGEAS